MTRAGRKKKHRSKPRKYSAARVYGTLGGWSKRWKLWGRYQKVKKEEWE